MRTLIVATALAAGTLVVPVATTAPAHATPCNNSARVTMWKADPFVTLRKNGKDSVYNRTQDPVTRTITYGYSHTYQVTHSWEVGASAGIDWKIVKASVNGKYGRAYTTSETTSRTDALTFTIRPRHTGWIRLVLYRRPVMWKKYNEIWNADKKQCVYHTIALAKWSPPKKQYVPITKRGQKFPA